MNKPSFFRSQWKLVLNIVTLLALGLLIYVSRDQLADTLSNLGKVNTWALLLLIPLKFLNYDAQVRLYRGLFKVVGNTLPYKYLFKTALELNFVNQVFPSGGAAGISYFGLQVSKGEGISGGKATLVQIMKLALTFLSFVLLILFGLLCLATFGKVSNLTIMVAATLSTLIVVGTFIFAYIVGSQRRINLFFTTVTQILNRLIQVVRPNHPETINIGAAKSVFDDIHDNYKMIKSSWRELRAPFAYALWANLTEILAIFAVYLAFGEVVNIGAIILAYAVANFAGLVSVLPGGIGIYEALMTAVLAGAGVPASVSLPVTVMFRVISTLIQVPPGYYFYQKALRVRPFDPEKVNGV